MKTYDYMEAVLEDVKQWIVDNSEYMLDCNDLDDFKQWLNDTLFAEDSVTGNGSGSYTFSTLEAEENLCHNMDLLREALEEFGCGLDYLAKGAEARDVTIRCYLLGQAIEEAFDDDEIMELWDKMHEEEEE